MILAAIVSVFIVTGYQQSLGRLVIDKRHHSRHEIEILFMYVWIYVVFVCLCVCNELMLVLIVCLWLHVCVCVCYVLLHVCVCVRVCVKQNRLTCSKFFKLHFAS